MSRVGKQPIQIPGGVQVELAGGALQASGPKGKLTLTLPEKLQVARNGSALKVTIAGESRSERALHGLYRSLIQNTVTGVLSGFEKRLELSGVGYQCAIKGKNLELSVGFSKPVVFEIPAGITCVAPDNTHLVVTGVDKQAVGQFAAQVRATRVPDPYKAKGVKYQGEFIRRKAGKAFGSSSS